MKKLLYLPILVLIFIIAGCTENNEPEQKSDPEEDQEVTSPEPDPEVVEQLDWEGEYVFIHDEIDGMLLIAGQENDQFTFQLNGSTMKLENEKPSTIALKGTGKIDAEEARLTFEDNEKCSGVLHFEEASLTFTMDKNDCQLNFEVDGTYAEIETENKPPAFSMQDNKIYINGLTFGHSPSDAKSIWGNPNQAGTDEPHTHGDYYQDFKSEEMHIIYYEKRLTTLTLRVDEEVLKDITENFKGEHYIDVHSDWEFFLVPEDGQLLVYKPDESADGSAGLLLIPADGNFFYYVEEGSYKRVN